MIPSLYCLYDKVACRYSHFCLANSDGEYVREMIAHRVSFPLNFEDTVCLCLGSLDFGEFDSYFSSSNFAFDSSSARVVPWSSWKQPESVADTLVPLGLGTEETVVAARSAIEKKIEEYRSRNESVPQWLSDELNLYVRRDS